MGDPFFEIVKSVIREDIGCDPIEIDFETAQAMKAAAREKDAHLMALGLATPEAIQRKNSAIPAGAELRVLDYGPSCVP
jgi:hypothetical protein